MDYYGFGRLSGPFFIRTYDSISGALDAFGDSSLFRKEFSTIIDQDYPRTFFSNWLDLVRLIETLYKNSGPFSIFLCSPLNRIKNILFSSKPVISVLVDYDAKSVDICTNIRHDDQFDRLVDAVNSIFWEMLEGYCRSIPEEKANELITYLYNQNNTQYINLRQLAGDHHDRWYAVENIMAPHVGLRDISPIDNHYSYILKFWPDSSASLEGDASIRCINAKYDRVLHTITCFDKVVMRVREMAHGEIIVDHFYARDAIRMEREGLSVSDPTPDHCIVPVDYKTVIRYIHSSCF